MRRAADRSRGESSRARGSAASWKPLFVEPKLVAAVEAGAGETDAHAPRAIGPQRRELGEQGRQAGLADASDRPPDMAGDKPFPPAQSRRIDKAKWVKT